MIEKVTNQNFKDTIENTDKLVILDFFASWCNPCSKFAPILESVNKQLENEIVIGKVNVDEEEILARQFDVESIPTIFLMKNGEVLSKNVGIYNENELKQMIQKFNK